MKKNITVLTPAYNRGDVLGNLYNSLLLQKDYNFEWLIVDDGSTDGTSEMVREWQKVSPFKIGYIYQANRGKHCALNTGIKVIETPLTFIVDSDDILTLDAIEIIDSDATEILENSKICGIGYLRGYSEEQAIGISYPKDRFIDDFISVRINQNIQGDKAEVWKTADLKECPFPEINGEKFFGEGYVWFKLAMTKQMLFVNKIIYITKYLEGGLTKSGRALRIKCPLGGMINAKIMMRKPFNFRNQMKGCLLYVAYANFANKTISFMMKDTEQPIKIILAYIPGRIIYIVWKKKFL